MTWSEERGGRREEGGNGNKVSLSVITRPTARSLFTTPLRPLWLEAIPLDDTHIRGQRHPHRWNGVDRIRCLARPKKGLGGGGYVCVCGGGGGVKPRHGGGDSSLIHRSRECGGIMDDIREMICIIAKCNVSEYGIQQRSDHMSSRWPPGGLDRENATAAILPTPPVDDIETFFPTLRFISFFTQRYSKGK